MNAKGIILLLATVTVLTAVVFAWNNAQISREVGSLYVNHVDKPQSLGATIYDKGSNPVGENLPDTNPLADVVNPFDKYKNPFESK